MDRQFAQQLANLQRAASRAGGSGNGGNGYGDKGGRGSTGNYDNYGSRDGRGGNYGGRDERDGNYSGRDGSSGYSAGSGGRYSDGGGNGRYSDGGEGRYDQGGGGGRDHRGGGGGGRFPGRGHFDRGGHGGRGGWDGRNGSRDGDRSNDGRPSGGDAGVSGRDSSSLGGDCRGWQPMEPRTPTRDPRILSDPRDRDQPRDPRSPHGGQGGRDPRILSDPRDPRDSSSSFRNDSRDPRILSDPRDPRDNRDPRILSDPRNNRDPRILSDPRDPRGGGDPRASPRGDPRSPHSTHGNRDPRILSDPRDRGNSDRISNVDPRDRSFESTRDNRDPRILCDPRNPGDNRESGGGRDKIESSSNRNFRDSSGASVPSGANGGRDPRILGYPNERPDRNDRMERTDRNERMDYDGDYNQRKRPREDNNDWRNDGRDREYIRDGGRDSRDGRGVKRDYGGRDYHGGGVGGGRGSDGRDFRGGRGRGGGGGEPYHSGPYVPMADAVKLIKDQYAQECQLAQNANTAEATTETTCNGQKRRHIALLFLTIDDLPHEHIWKEWLKSCSASTTTEDISVESNNNGANEEHGANGSNGAKQSNKAIEGPLVSILCHAKFPERITSPWLRDRHLIRLPRHVLNTQKSNERSQGNLGSQGGQGNHSSQIGTSTNENADEQGDTSAMDTNQSQIGDRQQSHPSHQSYHSQQSQQEELSRSLTNSKFAPKFHSRRPDWGSIEITRAMIDLLEEGLRIGATGNTGGSGSIPNATDNAGGEAEGDGNGAVDGNGPNGSNENNGNESSEVNGSNGKDVEADKVDRRLTHLRYLSSIGNSENIKSDKDIPPVDRFIFVSESCLPVATLSEVEMALFGAKKVAQPAVKGEKEGNGNETNAKASQPENETPFKPSPYDKSWINARSTPNNGYSRQLQWDEIRPNDIPSNLIWKSDQWIVLTRKHGEAIKDIPRYLNRRYLWTAFRRCRASDEMYFATALSVLGIIHRPIVGGKEEEVDSFSKGEGCAGSEIRRRKVTYCDWSMGAKNPASFTSEQWKEVVGKARGEGCLFARKFMPLRRGRMERQGSSLEGRGIVSILDWISAVVKKEL